MSIDRNQLLNRSLLNTEENLFKKCSFFIDVRIYTIKNQETRDFGKERLKDDFFDDWSVVRLLVLAVVDDIDGGLVLWISCVVVVGLFDGDADNGMGVMDRVQSDGLFCPDPAGP